MGSRLCVFGSINVDYVTRVDSIARPGETVLGRGFERHFGGKGANQAVAAARAGADVSMIGCVGDDEDGAAATTNLQREGIDVTGLDARHDIRTGRALIAVDASGENAITVIPGANLIARMTSVPPEVQVMVFQMELETTATLDALEAAASAKITTILNFAPVPAGLAGVEVARMLEATDILVVNETELHQLQVALGEHHADAAGLSATFGLDVVVTLGAAGADYSQRGSDVRTAPGRAIEAADTTGAGDTFVGVLAAATAQGMTFHEAVTQAICASALSCTKLGAQTGMPSPQQIAGMLAADTESTA
ncbi:ribokinase [Roseivivax marinus]|uniref:ribokinase n=1 Tax=Roseivivax marinus TaxID=1379903 RepID=UPI001F049C09|nr:ribokinase [Roseivivax marinus]UMA64418.1 ribokinase [Roseivivax marinus]